MVGVPTTSVCGTTEEATGYGCGRQMRLITHHDIRTTSLSLDALFLIPFATHDPHDPGALENHPVVAGQGAPALLNPAPHLQCLLLADVQTRRYGRWERSKPNERSQAFTLSIRVYPGPSPLLSRHGHAPNLRPTSSDPLHGERIQAIRSSSETKLISCARTVTFGERGQTTLCRAPSRRQLIRFPARSVIVKALVWLTGAFRACMAEFGDTAISARVPPSVAVAASQAESTGQAA